MKDSANFTTRSIQVAFLAIMAGVWYGLTKTGSVTPLFLPPIDVVFATFIRLVQTGQFWSAVRVTLFTIAQAWVIAVVAGLLVAYLVTRSRHWTEVMEPVIASTFAIPLTLLFPVFILFFGIGPASKVAYAATYGFFPVALITIAGLNSVDERYLRAAKSMGASSFHTFRHVLFPAAFPVILTGFRVSFFISFASVLGGETLSSAAGVGKAISLAAELMEPARMYAWIVFVIITAVSLNFMVSAIENRRREY